MQATYFRIDTHIASLYASTIFLSGFLLFTLEPLIARRILPWFGGSAAVWSACLVFYQTALLAGYFYAWLLARYLRPKAQGVLHIAVLTASVALLPIGPNVGWRLSAADHPAWLIFRMLTLAIGLPFLALSASTPLLQGWLALRGSKLPYYLFAISNLASLAALLAYPALIEPQLGTGQQSLAWSLVYALFAVGCGILAGWQIRSNDRRPTPGANVTVSLLQRVEWFALAACGSMLLLSVTNHIDENVAAVPLLWVLPLAVYLLSFVLTFGSLNIYRRALWLRLLAFAIATLAYAIYNINAILPLPISLPILLGGLFICCVFCHGELNRRRPAPAQLSEFYLSIAAGGAAGAIAIGIVAPAVFSGIYELPITLLATALLALAFTWHDGVWAIRLLWAAVACCTIVLSVVNFQIYHADLLSLRRSFYGSLRVVQTAHAGPEQQRILYHGVIEHGSQFVLPPRREHPTTYYGPDSGIGIVLREAFTGPKRVGIIGLGAGTLAAYGRTGDEFRFYEINPQIADLAQSLFFYLRETPAHTAIVIGDGRLALERDASAVFDVLAVDAFSGDAIPVHLLTREALLLYRRHLAPDGVIAFHVSNDFLDLAPVVRQVAGAVGYQAVLAHNRSDEDDGILAADWVLVTNNAAILANPGIEAHAKPIVQRGGARLWTDDYTNILGAFRVPEHSR